MKLVVEFAAASRRCRVYTVRGLWLMYAESTDNPLIRDSRPESDWHGDLHDAPAGPGKTWVGYSRCETTWVLAEVEEFLRLEAQEIDRVESLVGSDREHRSPCCGGRIYLTQMARARCSKCHARVFAFGHLTGTATRAVTTALSLGVVAWVAALFGAGAFGGLALAFALLVLKSTPMRLGARGRR